MVVQLRKIATDFGVAYEDVKRLSEATWGRFGDLPPHRKAEVADASLRVFKALGSDCARACYLKIRAATAPAHMRNAA